MRGCAAIAMHLAQRAVGLDQRVQRDRAPPRRVIAAAARSTSARPRGLGSIR